MNTKSIFIVLAAFILGIVSSLAVISIYQGESSRKYSQSSTTTYIVESEKTLNDEANTSIITRILGIENTKKSTPYDRIGEQNIHVSGDNVLINIKNAQWARFTDTHSMDPVLSASANAIEIVPKDYSEIHVGDIVSYKSEYADGNIIHRVIEIGFDDKGWYCIMKGDNNSGIDPGKIRFSQIQRVVVAIIY
jgi:hypothetical protein